MSCAVNVSGAWKYAKQAYVNVGGSWKPCQNIYVNVSGAWKPLYTYSYATGNWGLVPPTAAAARRPVRSPASGGTRRTPIWTCRLWRTAFAQRTG